MQVILKKDVPKIGRAYDVVDVNEGYANNFLFPRGLAIKATPELVESSKKQKAIKAGEKMMRHNLLEKTITEIDKKEFEIKKPANDQGTLFSKIHEKDICEVLKKETGIIFEEKMIILEHPIDKLGVHDIELFSEGVHANIKIKVIK